MAYSVRALQADDKPRWRELFDGYLRFYEATVPETTIELTFERLLGDGEWDPCGLILQIHESRDPLWITAPCGLGKGVTGNGLTPHIGCCPMYP